MRDGESVDFGAEIRKLVQRVQTNNPDIIAATRVRKAWESTADARALEHTDTVYVVPGSMGEEVVVYVDSQLWAVDLNLQSELLRLRINLAIQGMFEAEGFGSRTPSDGVLFEYEQNEYVKSLKFVPSKEKYTKRFRQDEEENLEEIGRVDVEPVGLSDEELAALYIRVSHIQDDQLRQKAFDAARASMEVAKGRAQQSESPER